MIKTKTTKTTKAMDSGIKQVSDRIIRHLDIDQIDEINDKLGFVMAVLDAIYAIGDTQRSTEINGRTLIYLASEAEEKMEKITEIINAG